MMSEEHFHHCHICVGTWSHRDPDCTELPREMCASEMTDMVCPVHDTLPFHENGTPRREAAH